VVRDVRLRCIELFFLICISAFSFLQCFDAVGFIPKDDSLLEQLGRKQTV